MPMGNLPNRASESGEAPDSSRSSAQPMNPGHGGSGPLQRTPPIRGAFPLDHDGECRAVVLQYLACLRHHQHEQGPCRALAQRYLACRMARGLMHADEWPRLGFPSAARDAEPRRPTDDDNKGSDV